MKTQAKTLLAILLALVIALVAIHQNLLLGTSNVKAIAVTSPQKFLGLEDPRTTSGGPTISPVLDGTLGGYDLVKLAGTIDKPCPQWHTPFLNAGWSESQWATARWIIYRESRCLEDAFNGVDAGLLQINEYHRPLVESFGLRFPDDLFDGETNLWVAYMLWLDYGWEPWIYKGVVPGE